MLKAIKTLTADILNAMATGDAAEAMALAKLGPKYLPVCPADHKGVSRQHLEKCQKPGKAPLLAKWPDKASDDPNVLGHWFNRRMNLNLGMTLGAEVGVVGFDIDGDYGRIKMKQLFNGLVPLTWEFSTPTGGSRLLFRVPVGVKLRKFADVNPLAKHEELAFLADGQMTVIPPSMHQNGGQYLWITGRGPGDISLADLPDHVLDQMRSVKVKSVSKRPIKQTTVERTSSASPTEVTLASDCDKKWTLSSKKQDELQILASKCEVIKDAISEQRFNGCSEPHWHHITSMLVRAGYADAALTFSKLSQKHDQRSEQRILEMESEGSRATYGPTRCSTFGCDPKKIAKCHPSVRLDKRTQEPTNSPITLLLTSKKKASLSNSLSLEEYIHLIKGNHGIHQGHLCKIKYNNEGQADYFPLTNFVARIAKSTVKDNGSDRLTFYEIDGLLISSQKRLPAIQVPAQDFESMKWLTMWGPEPNLFPGHAVRDLVRFAIQSTAPAAINERIFTHLGWVKIDEKWAYLHAGGALGMPNIKVELEPRLQNYRLPDSFTDAKAAMKASLNLLNIAPHRVTLVLWALTYLSPLCECLRWLGIEPKFLVWLFGYTGSRKTTLAKLFLSHFGDLLEHPPASFKDTANSVEKRGFDTKDSLLLIDDYHPTSSPKVKQSMELLAQQILRGYGDRVARGRMKQDTSLRVDYPPRGNAIITAEDLIGGGSSVARLFPTELYKTDVNLDLLTKAQQDFEMLGSAMTGYLEWVAQAMNATDFPDLRQLFVEKRHEASQLGIHGRLVEASVWLYLGLHVGLEYAESVGAINIDLGQGLRTEGWEVFLRIASEQGKQVADNKASARFVAIVSQLLANKTIHTDDIHKELLPETVPRSSCHVGWHDDRYYYFLPGVLYNQISQFLSRQGEQFPISESMLWKELADAGVTHTETTKENGRERRHFLVKKTAKKQRVRMLWVKRNVLEEREEERPHRQSAVKPPKVGA